MLGCDLLGALAFARLAMLSGAAIGLALGGVLGLFGGLTSDTVDATAEPNEGIRRSVISAALGGLIAAPLVWLAAVGPFVLIQGYYPSDTWIVAVGIAVVVALNLGGSASLSHFTLRLLLWCTDIMPLRYGRFLDDCVARVFLRKVGGGYIFVHRLLLEYFADQHTFPESASKRQWQGQLGLAGACVCICVALIALPIWIYQVDIQVAVLLRRVTTAMVNDDFEQAMNTFRQANQLAPEDPGISNQLCWTGSLAGRAADVIDLCDQAVYLAPDSGNYRDSRGVARALTGDYGGAIEDFKFFVAWAATREDSEQLLALRKEWIVELEGGRNPFDAEMLQRLKFE